MKAAQRLKAECVPPMEHALHDQTTLVNGLIADAQKAADELTEHANSSINRVMMTAGVGLLLSLIASMWIGIKGLSGPISELKVVMEAFARNDLSADVPSTRRSDEIGEMARTVEVFKTNGLAVERMKAEQLAAEHRTAEQRKADMLKLASDFESAVGEIIDTVSSASTELEASARTLSSTAERSRELTTA